MKTPQEPSRNPLATFGFGYLLGHLLGYLGFYPAVIMCKRGCRTQQIDKLGVQDMICLIMCI